MGDSLLDRMYEAKSKYETEYYSFFSDGSVEERTKTSKELIEHAKEDIELNSLAHYLEMIARDHATCGKYDSLDVNLSFGIVFNAADVDEKKKPKGPSHAIKGLVDVRIDGSSSYLGRDLVKENAKSIYYGGVGYVSLENLISFLENEGLKYNGPETYDEVLYDFIYEKPLTATITADLSKKRNKTLTKK